MAKKNKTNSALSFMRTSADEVKKKKEEAYKELRNELVDTESKSDAVVKGEESKNNDAVYYDSVDDSIVANGGEGELNENSIDTHSVTDSEKEDEKNKGVAEVKGKKSNDSRDVKTKTKGVNKSSNLKDLLNYVDNELYDDSKKPKSITLSLKMMNDYEKISAYLSLKHDVKITDNALMRKILEIFIKELPSSIKKELNI